jgi:hypothetical protein
MRALCLRDHLDGGYDARVLSDVDQLILNLGLGLRDPTGYDLDMIRWHVSQAGFDPHLSFDADRRVIGLQRTVGTTIQRDDQIPTDELHYLRHVIAREEWPSGTTQRQYEDSLRNLAARPQSGILVSEVPPFGWHVAFVGRSDQWQGTAGFAWMLVEYRVTMGHWTSVARRSDIRESEATQAMAATPDLIRRTEITLVTATAMLDDVLEGAEQWGARPEAERADFFLDWEETVQRLADLACRQYAGEVSPDQQQRLADLARRLQEARDVIVRLGLDYPELGHLSLAS